MKLVIHCGLHKTGTSSFQLLCSTNRSLLKDVGVYYPKYRDFSQHNGLVWDAQQSGLMPLSAHLTEWFAEAQADCHTVLISGEDFENCIVDVALSSEIDALARDAGFDAVEWVVVTRPIQEYINSLYSEMSNHGVVLSYDIIRKAAYERGYVCCSTANYNYIFVFDYPRFADRFRKHVSGQVIEYNFDEFVLDHPGMILLRRLLSDNSFERFRELALVNTTVRNPRLNTTEVEANYLATALGIRKLRNKVFRPLAAPFIRLRRRKVQMESESRHKST